MRIRSILVPIKPHHASMRIILDKIPIALLARQFMGATLDRYVRLPLDLF